MVTNNTSYTSRLNFSFNRIAFADGGCITNNPTLRSYDWITQENGLPVRDTYSFDAVVLPSQSITLKSTERTILADATSVIGVNLPVSGSDYARYRWNGTGTAPGFRTLRNIGVDATTNLTITLSGISAAIISTASGTAASFSTCQIGDNIYLQPNDDTFTSPFNIVNTSLYPGMLYTVIDKTSSTITVRNPGNMTGETVALGANFASAIRVFSSTGVQLADSVVFDPTCNLNVQNKTGQFDVFMVTDRDLYLLNSSAVTNTPVAIGGTITPPIRVFSDIISFMAVDATGAITLRFNNNSSSDLTLYPYTTNKAFFAGSINATSIQAINNTSESITIRINTASF